MKRTIKAWVPINVKERGRAWPRAISDLRREVMDDFTDGTDMTWGDWESYGWVVVRCDVTYDDRQSRRKSKRRKPARKGGGR